MDIIITDTEWAFHVAPIMTIVVTACAIAFAACITGLSLICRR